MPKATNRVGLYAMVYEYVLRKYITLQNLLPTACRGVAVTHLNIYHRLSIIGVMGQTFDFDVSSWWLPQLCIILAVSPGDHSIRTVLTRELCQATCMSRGIDTPTKRFMNSTRSGTPALKQWHCTACLETCCMTIQG